MTIQVVGAGLGRTGTKSLKFALEHLLGGTCHHMFEVMSRPNEPPVWQAAAEGSMPNWSEFLADYTAIVDWPGAAFWPELHAAFPEAIVLLSVRDLDQWFDSASRTIFTHDPDTDTPASRMWHSLVKNRFVQDYRDRQIATEAAARHNSAVLSDVDRSKLVVWHPGDGWAPICAALGLAVPSIEFPHTNSTKEFRKQAGLD